MAGDPLRITLVTPECGAGSRYQPRLQQEQPDDYVVATGETHTVEEFVTEAFQHAGIEDWRRYVRQDPRFLRPAEVDLLVGDAAKAHVVLGWHPQVDFYELVKLMVDHDLKTEQTRLDRG